LDHSGGRIEFTYKAGVPVRQVEALNLIRQVIECVICAVNAGVPPMPTSVAPTYVAIPVEGLILQSAKEPKSNVKASNVVYGFPPAPKMVSS
jgi:hypothetical protein